MATSAPHQHDDRVSILDLVVRSRRLGSRCVRDPRAIPIEFVEQPADATAEAYITRMTTAGSTTHVELVLDHGLSGSGTLSAFEAEWLALEEGQIVPVRIDRRVSVR